MALYASTAAPTIAGGDTAELATAAAARDLLASCETDAILFVKGDTSIHALWYLQAVDGLRPDVAVVSLGHVRAWYVEQLAARFPAIAWPAVTDSTPPSAWGRALVEAVADLRPVYLSLAVDPSPFLRSDASVRAFGSVPRGIVSWLLPYGTEISAAELSDFQAEFFEAAIPALAPLDGTLDMDTSRSAPSTRSACRARAICGPLARNASACERVASC